MKMEARTEFPKPDLTLQTVEGYLAQLRQWDTEIRFGPLESPFASDVYVQEQLLRRAYKEDLRLRPLILAELSARRDLVAQAFERRPVGEQMQGENLIVTGHISNSTLWLINNASNTMQTMVRLLVAENGKLSIVDVYSDSVSPISVPDEDGNERINVLETEPSRALRILQYVESQNAAVLGWIPIEEVDKDQVPSYSVTSSES